MDPRHFKSRSGHKASTAAFPDVCFTPPMNPGTSPIPIPYANAIDGQAANGNEKAKKVQKELIDAAHTIGATHVDSATKAGLVSGMMQRKAPDKSFATKLKFSNHIVGDALGVAAPFVPGGSVVGAAISSSR